MLIQVTPELLRGKAGELRTHRSEHDDVINKIRNLVNSLPEDFKGEAASAYIEKFNSMESTFTQFSEMLENFAKMLDNNANILEEADKNAANQNK